MTGVVGFRFARALLSLAELCEDLLDCALYVVAHLVACVVADNLLQLDESKLPGRPHFLGGNGLPLRWLRVIEAFRSYDA
jgi:hypothetical protein